MMHVSSLSILLCTYNRAGLLEDTLAALVSLRAPDACTVEIVVVDNNSNDLTREVVRQAAGISPWPIRYAVEQSQGKSFALNRGLALAAGDIVALTDDDVLPEEDWLVRIVEQFRAEDIRFVFGKVLPRWQTFPPPELLTTAARDIWGPLALIDYGDEPVFYDDSSFRTRKLPIGANLAVRREAIEQIGGWRTHLGKVDNTLIAGEDHDLCVRLYRAGLYRGLYDPKNVVRHYVPASRTTRKYFRNWYYWHGRTMARMADVVYVDLDLASVPYVAGAPRFVYRQFLHQILRWLRSAGRSDALALVAHELKLIEYCGFLVESWRRRTSVMHRGGPRAGDVALEHAPR